MKSAVTDPRELVKTQGEPVSTSDITVPEPPGSLERLSESSHFDPQVVHDLTELANRVGGLEVLKQMIDTLMQLRH